MLFEQIRNASSASSCTEHMLLSDSLCSACLVSPSELHLGTLRTRNVLI